jgi:hypothetical protein
VTGVIRLCAIRRLGAGDIDSMSFIRLGLGVGKQVELWDSNVHKVREVAVAETASVQWISQLRH